MVEEPEEKASDGLPEDGQFRHTIVRKEDRKLRARSQRDRGPWFWLGMFGLVGWSIAIPTLLGIVAGVWLDRRFEGRVSWTLTMLFIGVALGCWTAWYWVNRESQQR
jgi:ATP synthase protein I